MGYMLLCNAPSLSNNYWVNDDIVSTVEGLNKLIKK